ncbi:MAG: stage V sporulation protein AC [Oscillospiraceae bacterium]
MIIITNKEYDRLNKRYSPNSKSYITIPSAFAVGGLICVIGQFLINFYGSLGANEEISATAASVTLVFIASLLTGLNVFDDIAKFAGAGTLVPITGFSNAVCAPALEFKSEGFILGLASKMFVIAGPVIVYGVSASVVYGIIIYIFGAY